MSSAAVTIAARRGIEPVTAGGRPFAMQPNSRLRCLAAEAEWVRPGENRK